jgi:hypothetical protein
MEYEQNDARLAKLSFEIAEFERIDAYRNEHGAGETAHDEATWERLRPAVGQLREERKALLSVMRAFPGTGHM